MNRKKMALSSLVIFLFSILFTSCEKSSSPFKLSPLTQEVLQKESIQEMRQGQAMLSVEERETLWKQKLDFILTNPNETLTTAQRAIVIQIQSFLEVNGMEALVNNPSLGTQFLDQNDAGFSKEFNKEQLFVLLESPFLSQDLVVSTLNESNLYSVIGSRYADGGGTCSCLYDMGCPGSGNNCNRSSGCAIHDDVEMCGVFGTSSCKGTCTGFDPVNDL